MARQMGNNPFKGTIDGITFYHTLEDGYLARAKSSLTAERVMNHPNFKRFVASGKDFGEAIYAGQLLRTSLTKILFPLADGKLSSRMNMAMLNVVQSDPVNGMGERKFNKGNPLTLLGFEFNAKHPLEEVFKGDYITTRNKANNDLYISIPPFKIAEKITTPEYASHFQFIVARTNINFGNGHYKNVVGETIRFALNQPVTESFHFILPPQTVVGGIDFLVLGIKFFGYLQNIPRDAISQRKRNKLKGQVQPDGIVPYTGTLKIIRIGPPLAIETSCSNES